MANTTLSPNMNLPVPVVSVDPGPDYALNVNSCLAILDAHTHTPGNGVQITSAALNINADVSFGDNNLTELRSTRFHLQSAPLGAAADVGCIYASGVDLYYNDGNGNQIQITQSGGVAGSPGNIANLTSPASASYVAANSTFVWQSDVSTAANMDGGSVILRNLTVSSKGLTLSPPSAMAADYTLTLPALPGSLQIVTCDTSGNLTATMAADNSTLQMSGTQLSIKAGGVGTTELAAGGVTTAKIAAATIKQSNMAILNPQTVAVTATTGITTDTIIATKSVTVGGGKVWVIANVGGQFLSKGVAPSSNYPIIQIGLYRNGVAQQTQNWTGALDTSVYAQLPGGSVQFIDTPGAGTFTYTLHLTVAAGLTLAGSTAGVMHIIEL